MLLLKSRAKRGIPIVPRILRLVEKAARKDILFWVKGEGRNVVRDYRDLSLPLEISERERSRFQEQEGKLFVGHYGPSFAGKAADQRLPLWLLFIAVQFVDVLWAIFVLLGIEKVRIVPGITASSPLDLYYMPYTHSLAGALGWSLLAFIVCQMVPRLRGARTGLILAAAVFSHWILDLIVHRPDLPLYDSVLKMGFGLWNYRIPAFVLEIAVLFGGAALYLKTVPRKGRVIA